MPGQPTLPTDNNGNPVQAGRTVSTVDESATPKASPITVSGSILELVAPSDARAITISVSVDSGPLRISEDSGMTSYYVIPNGGVETIGVDPGEMIYVLKDDTADSTVSFMYATL